MGLAQVLDTSDLSKSWINRIISARENYKYQNSVLSTMHDLETYAENTAASLLYLELEALGIKDVNADHCASHIGKAIGIASVLKGVPIGLQNREFSIPSDIMGKV